MTLKLVSAVMVHTFGRDARSPRQTAMRRVLFAFLFIAALDVLITQTLGNLRLPNDLFQSWLTIILILAAQIVVGLIMLIVRASGYGLHDDQINDILGILPVNESVRWIAGLIPGLCAVLMILTLSIGPLVVIATSMNLKWYFFLTGIGIGLMSGIGVGTYQPHRSVAINFIIMAALVLAELQLLDHILTFYQIYENSSLVAFAALITLILVPFYWLSRSIQTWSIARQRKPTAVTLIRVLPVSLFTWLGTKILRHPKILRSSVVLTGISGGLTYFWLHTGGGSASDIMIVTLCLSCIAALAAADIRSLTRAQAAPEMIMVQGSRYYVAQQIMMSITLAAIVTSPLWIALLATHWHTHSLGLAVIGQILLGSSVALLATTIFVPSQQDISTEFLSAALTTCLILGLEKLTASLKFATSLRSESILWIGLGLGLGTIIFSIEQHRNNYYWKGTKHHVS